MATQTAADLITGILHPVGVRRIYGVVGDNLNGITESLPQKGRHRLDPHPA
jgi:pyruvate dehydrogenase (quinone)